MKFQPDRFSGGNVISRHDAGSVWVGATRWRESVIVPWKGELLPWDAAELGALTAEHFARIALLKPELVIFGSGRRMRFVSPALLRPLIERGIGVETMDSAAACRTYNVLAAEEREVVAALVLEGDGA
ncbi:hypothetical protein CKO44_18340 [Rubrivivax gelatinosus]|uniref:Mth938-like domain-containing protein n=1 Tax=Rubrivivax gelatinosus TaxID=28068 RepID=A0ABS1DZR1_RUBGE|nr:Mth938-like domain-containing protein [Rubrivivax gelatinosus]MBK1615422.1 hypothetical protein [Rubrivivax gelatinosus]MBK1714122.1 hypothetical protein [Rubrivivax gelatinosus]